MPINVIRQKLHNRLSFYTLVGLLLFSQSFDFMYYNHYKFISSSVICFCLSYFVVILNSHWNLNQFLWANQTGKVVFFFMSKGREGKCERL